MKKIALIMTICILSTIVYSQIVQSSCDAPDDVIEDYNVDAGVLTLRKFYENDFTYKDSIEIPTVHVDTFLNALLAVWNATELPARDTVVDMLEIAAAFNYDVRAFRLKCDTSVWSNNLIDGMETTGNDTIDSLMNKYNLGYLMHLGGIDYHYIWLISSINYNMPQLAKRFEYISGVSYVFATEGQYSSQMKKNIIVEIHQGYVDLEYSFGWGDCSNGCFYWRHWYFRVYDECLVEYLGSDGDVMTWYNIIEGNKQDVEVYPNPFNDYLYIYGINGSFEYAIMNIKGDVVQREKMEGNIIKIKKVLNPGIYILELQNNNCRFRKKITKL